MSDGLGAEGRVVAEGRLGCSGDYVVEEEEEEEDDDDGRPAGIYRRLIFLKNEGVVQTEVRMAGIGDTPALVRQERKRDGNVNTRRLG